MANKIKMCEQKLKKREIKCTRQRKAIMKILIKNKYPISAREIYKQLKKEHSKLRLSTIYRNLNLFVKKDLVKKIRLNRDNRENKFELKVKEHHHHLICVKCGEIIPLECPLQEFKNKIQAETNYEIVDHNFNMYGICPECKEE